MKRLHRIFRASFLVPFFGAMSGIFVALLAGFLILRTVDHNNRDALLEAASEVMKLPIEQSGEEYRDWACQVLDYHSPSTPLNCKLAADHEPELAPQQPPQLVQRADGLSLDTWRTSIEVYECDRSQGSHTIAALIGEHLGRFNYGSFGFKEWTQWSIVPRDRVEGTTTILVDINHPEHMDATRIARIISTIESAPPAQIVDETEAETPWQLSVIVCPE
ncbi:MAG: hypothetical protein AAGF49_14235 [Pseudomonadota bacterium]